MVVVAALRGLERLTEGLDASKRAAMPSVFLIELRRWISWEKCNVKKLGVPHQNRFANGKIRSCRRPTLMTRAAYPGILFIVKKAPER